MKKLLAACALTLTLALAPAAAFANILATPLHQGSALFGQIIPGISLDRLAPLYALMQQPKTTAPAACPADGLDCPRHGGACPNAACPANGVGCQLHGDACPNASGRDDRGGNSSRADDAADAWSGSGHHGGGCGNGYGHGCRR